MDCNNSGILLLPISQTSIKDSVSKVKRPSMNFSKNLHRREFYGQPWNGALKAFSASKHIGRSFFSCLWQSSADEIPEEAEF